MTRVQALSKIVADDILIFLARHEMSSIIFSEKQIRIYHYHFKGYYQSNPSRKSKFHICFYRFLLLLLWRISKFATVISKSTKMRFLSQTKHALFLRLCDCIEYNHELSSASSRIQTREPIILSHQHHHKKKGLSNVDPLKPHFYMVKLGFTGVYIIFLISSQKHRLWVLVRNASLRQF